MSFQPKQFNDIFEDMRKRTSVITDFETGSVARTLYESFAYEIALLYEKMQLVYLSAYVDTAEGQQLDMVVAILGIKRGLPDFAEGEVTFQRDIGNQDITISQGTLVATVDTPTMPKKVYQTEEIALFRKDQTSVTVKVQAVNRGESEVTPADTLVVLPRPIAGIKSVTNTQVTRFTGKRRETDEELRSRAKNALIASGKATLLSIENALLSLPKVKDVKVWEKFRYARGTVTLKRSSDSDPLEIPKGTVLTATYSPEPTKPDQKTERSFITTEKTTIATDKTSVEVSVQAQAEGQAGELTTIDKQVTWVVEGALKTLLQANNAKAIALGDFGVVEVFVDCDDFDKQKPQLEAELDRVRAAGIFTRLQSAIPLKVDGIFQITTPSDLKLSPEERRKLEQTVETEITAYINELRMGQPLLFAQIFKRVLSITNVTNLEEFMIRIEKQQEGKPTTEKFELADKQIEANIVERFQPNHIYVASGTKELLVNIQFKSETLTESELGSITKLLEDKFKLLSLGESVSQKTITDQLGSGVSGVEIRIHHWYQADSEVSKLDDTSSEIKPSFVEKIALGELFAYSKVLNIRGALKLTLSPTPSEEKKQAIYGKVSEEIKTYLNSLKAKEDIVLRQFVAIAEGVDQVQNADLDPNDFQTFLGTVEQKDRVLVKEGKIKVEAFEKAQLGNFCITSEAQPVPVEVTIDKVTLTLVGIKPQNEASLMGEVKSAVVKAIETFFAQQAPGKDIKFTELKSAIENLVFGASYAVTTLNLTTKSQKYNDDERVQSWATDTGTPDIKIRSVEIATLKPNYGKNVTVESATTPPTIPPQITGGG
jgi:uncharacterized phage protein gp47/JayE